jgi:hypothetical protein
MIVGVGLCLNVVAQNEQSYYRNRYESSNGYWTLYTDYASRHTTVKFYTATDQLLYEEVLAGQYVKLNKKNVRLFNEMLTRLTNQDLVASVVKPTSLVTNYTHSPAESSFFSARSQAAELTVEEKSVDKTLLVNTVFLNESEKLQVLFHNPKGQRVKVLLKNAADQVVYQEHSFLLKYNRSFDLSGVDAGVYALIITGAGEKSEQKLIISYGFGGKQVIQIENRSFLANRVAKDFQPDLLNKTLEEIPCSEVPK